MLLEFVYNRDFKLMVFAPLVVRTGTAGGP